MSLPDIKLKISGNSLIPVKVGSNYVGKSAYQMAVEAGYTGTEEEFATLQAQSATNANKAKESADSALATKAEIDEIAKSIPKDYTELSKQVDDLEADHILRVDTDGRVYFLEG